MKREFWVNISNNRALDKDWYNLWDRICSHTHAITIDFFNLIFGFDCFSHRNSRASKGMKDKEIYVENMLKLKFRKTKSIHLLCSNKMSIVLKFILSEQHFFCFVCYLYVSGLIYVYACEFIFFLKYISRQKERKKRKRNSSVLWISFVRFFLSSYLLTWNSRAGT